MHRRFISLLQHAGLWRIATVVIVAIVAVGATGYGLIEVVDGSRGRARPAPSPTPLTIADVDPSATPVRVATAIATPGASAVGGEATGKEAASSGACAVEGAKPVAKAPGELAAPGAAMVTVGALNLRAGPSTDCPIVGSLGFGMQVHIGPELIKAGDYLWRKVKTPEGEGYTVASSYQNLPSVPPTGVPVLMYHHIGEGSDKYYVPPKEFEKQVSWLKKHGFVSITPRDLYHAMYSGLALPAKPVMFTIDDGNPSTMDFQRILAKYDFRGVYFLPNYAQQSDEEIRTLARSGQVCGHTVDHPDLATLSYDEQYYEIMNNKEWLEKIIGEPVTCFAYPFGSYNDVTNEIMAESGYKLAFNAWGGSALIDAGANQFHILRYGVYSSYSWDTFLEVVRQKDGAPS